MKHIKAVTQHPAKASTDIGIGQIITIIAQILTILGTAISQKNASA